MPRDENGIIQPQEDCRRCEYLRECLRAAIAAKGGVEEVKAAGRRTGERPKEAGGIIGAISRWSARKSAAQKRTQQVSTVQE
jgi:hypothetical protein